jgi:hypothetical protein
MKGLFDISKTKLTNWQIIFILTILFVNSLIFYFVPLNILDGNDDWSNGIGAIIVWLVVDFRKLKKQQFISLSKIGFNPIKSWRISSIIILGSTIIMYLFEGINSIWKGTVLSAIIILGLTIHFWIENKLINHFLKN